MFQFPRALRFTICIMSALLFVFFPFVRQVDAHAYSASYTTLNLTKSSTEMAYSLDELSVIELVGGDINENGMLEEEEFAAVKDQLLSLLQQNITMKIGNVPEDWTHVESINLTRQGDETKVVIKISFPPVPPSQPISLTDQLYINNTATANYVDLLTINYGKQKSTSALSGKSRVWAMQMTDDEYADLHQDAESLQLNSDSEQAAEQPNAVTEQSNTHSGWFSFFKLGIQHILSGYDHLLFLFSLLIARQTFKQYATMITAFTIAHSITLTLTVLGWIDVPAELVEPAIALSICFVAIDNMVRDRVNYRWVLTFLFGLVHGMGFADILKEMDIPRNELAVNLISFNLGIETVQVIMIAVLLPLLALLHRWKYAKRAVYVSSSVALVLGGVWLVQRIWFN